SPSSAPQSPISEPRSPAPAERALWHATLAPGATAFSAPRPIVATPLLMENWADFASLCVGTDGALTAQWFQKSAPDAGGYDGWFSRSDDGGRTWRTPARLGHEFVALAPLSQGRTLAVWLESARAHDPHAAPRPKRDPAVKRDPAAPRPARDPHAPYAPSMKLLARLLAPDGATLREWTVDPDVCTCCQNTLAVLPGDRVFAAYRGHTADEIRDNRSALFDLSSGTWSAPAALRDDLWKIPACPVNGPAADARGPALAVAWFTAANGTPRVQARTSPDAGHTFTAPVVIDLGRPMGRIETVMLADQTALILWMETGTAENAAGIYARRLWPDGSLSAAHLVADSSQARSSGFPRAALRPDGHVVLAFTRPGDTTQVRLLELDPAALLRPTSLSVLPSPTGNSATPGLSPIPLEFCIAPALARHP
ncbi:MAG: sialidase family protein, partial [Verrucomicrobia bacterium]|nr:sialidase family protein [Verrucomicrobiota bacterium]